MKTSELTGIVSSLDIVIENSFNSLGNLNQNKENMLSYLDDEKYLHDFLANPNISALITRKEFIPSVAVDRPIGLIISENPRFDFFLIHNYLAQKTDFYSVKFDTQIGSNNNIHPTAYISPFNVKIGDNCDIGPHVSICDGTTIGNNVVICSGTSIGHDGSEYKRSGNTILHVNHAGGVYIHDNVEIQANCCIAKGIFDDNTEIGESTKLGSLVCVTHAVRIGKRCLIMSSVTIAGSTTVGDDVWIGPGSTISNQITIGDNAYLGIASVVTQNIPSGSRFIGVRITGKPELSSDIYKEQEDGGDLERTVLKVAATVFLNESHLTIYSNKDNTYGWDSLGNMNLLSALEEKFCIEFDIDDFQKMYSLSDILGIISERLID